MRDVYRRLSIFADADIIVIKKNLSQIMRLIEVGFFFFANTFVDTMSLPAAHGQLLR